MHVDFVVFVGSFADIATILQFLSGMLVCRQYVVNKTTGDSSPLPFICGVISCAMWLLYGLAIRDTNIILVNIIGLLLMSTYVMVFYSYTFKRTTLLCYIYTTFIGLSSMVAYYTYEEDCEHLITRIGLLASLMTVITIGAPMSQLNYVMRVKNTSCLPFPMILMSFVVSSLWLTYGLLEEDFFIAVPNILGDILAISQLMLFVIYPNQPSLSLTKNMVA